MDSHPLLRSIVVLGAGTMGARIAAHLANHGVAVSLLDMAGAPGTERNRAAQAGLQSALKSRPEAFFEPALSARITLGNFEDDLGRVAAADWVIEAVVEDLAIKQALLAKVAPHLSSDAILTSNTSGLPIAAIGAMLPPNVRRRWFGTHFFNPPRYMRLVELIPTPETDPAALARIAAFVDQRLGKGVVHAKDTPNFIANRIGTFSMLNVVRVMTAMQLSPEQVDALTGPILGWPKSATFRTMDLVGLDLLAHVVRNSYANLPNDERREVFHVPAFLEQLLERKWLGDKTGQGFYKKVRAATGESEILSLDLATFEYRPRQKVRFPSLDMAKTIEDPAERLRSVVFGQDVAGRFLWTTLSELFLYSAARVPEISDDLYEIDRAMRWGFNWQMGPFEMWDALGLQSTVQRLQQEGHVVPALVQRVLESGGTSFYRMPPPPAARREVFCLAGGYQAVPEPPEIIRLAALHHAGREVQRNPGCSLVDLGDGVGCLEFHTKMNALGPDIVQMVTRVLRDPHPDFEAFVISNDGEHFSAGANLALVLLEAQEENWEDLDAEIRAFQAMTMAVKYAARPVVLAPFNLALGGGCELLLHAPRIVAHDEIYTGLVELGVGLIPAGGGCKEMTLRAVQAAQLAGPSGRGASVELQEALKTAFETIAMAKVSTSALDARRLGFLRATDRTVANRDRLLGEAKREALAQLAAGYATPLPTLIPAPGSGLRTTLQLGAYLMREAEYISEYELGMVRKLAHVLCGGDAPAGSPLSEQNLLDLEREAFLSLCGQKKTQERIQFTLKTGKTLRN